MTQSAHVGLMKVDLPSLNMNIHMVHIPLHMVYVPLHIVKCAISSIGISSNHHNAEGVLGATKINVRNIMDKTMNYL